MINKVFFHITDEHSPYKNISLEEQLFLNIGEHECLLYLWQNEHTVVIGQNQNVWRECNLPLMKKNTINIARRLSGGGAVYHDLGNLNFTFFARKQYYNVDKQLEVILKAVNKFSVHAEKSGRNDITISGCKFSGNAFYTAGNQKYHHGTLLVNANLADMARYLNVDQSKLKSKGVQSVRARVANLSKHNKDITIASLTSSLVEAFSEVYGVTAQPFDMSRIDTAKWMNREQIFASWDWLYGSPIKFTYTLENRFDWGNIELLLNVQNGKIQDLHVYSDSLFPGIINNIRNKLNSCIFSKDEISAAVLCIETTENSEKIILNDIANWINKQSF